MQGIDGFARLAEHEDMLLLVATVVARLRGVLAARAHFVARVQELFLQLFNCRLLWMSLKLLI
jgi:hypothetical protein